MTHEQIRATVVPVGQVIITSANGIVIASNYNSYHPGDRVFFSKSNTHEIAKGVTVRVVRLVDIELVIRKAK